MFFKEPPNLGHVSYVCGLDLEGAQDQLRQDVLQLLVLDELAGVADFRPRNHLEQLEGPCFYRNDSHNQRVDVLGVVVGHLHVRTVSLWGIEKRSSRTGDLVLESGLEKVNNFELLEDSVHHHDVRGLQVSVNYSLFMELFKSLGENLVEFYPRFELVVEKELSSSLPQQVQALVHHLLENVVIMLLGIVGTSVVVLDFLLCVVQVLSYLEALDEGSDVFFGDQMQDRRIVVQNHCVEVHLFPVEGQLALLQLVLQVQGGIIEIRLIELFETST